MTPNEIAEHLRSEADKLGASSDYLSFTTRDGNAEGRHSYKGLVHGSISDGRKTIQMMAAD